MWECEAKQPPQIKGFREVMKETDEEQKKRHRNIMITNRRYMWDIGRKTNI